jgi:ATP-dependent Lhr-like helicase
MRRGRGVLAKPGIIIIMDVLDFHPAVLAWFAKNFVAPTAPQARAWPAIKEGRHTLIAAPTGSGKTLAAFLAAIDDLVRLGVEGRLEDKTYVVYVSPLKALSNDIQRNLQAPLEGIQQELQLSGISGFDIRTMVRSGDTPASERARMTRRPPHIIVTTPESLYILLTSEGGRRMLGSARTLIIDEIHALVQDKRGSHLSLSIERLQALVQQPLVRIGLSATQRPIEEVARFLVGTDNLDRAGVPNCTIIDSGHIRKLDLQIEVPGSPLEAVMSSEVWDEVYDRLALLINEHRSTLVFVNTRRLAERVCRHLGERVGDENITSHHGSLAKEKRLSAEQRLKNGELRALVATASLELGIDIGAVDLVCQLGSTRSIATLLQRVGRSGHTIGGVPKGRIFPQTRDELVESAALVDAVRRGELDTLSIPEQPLDILAQQMVAALASDEFTEDDLFKLAVRAYPYRNLSRADFDAVVKMLAEGYTTRRGRRSAYIHRDGVNHRLRGRRGARIAAITSGGAIPDTADYAVILEPAGTLVGTVNEDFAIESMQGDIFQLGNSSWRIMRVEPGKVRVEDAHGQPPSIPFWLGEAPGRTKELSQSVSRLRISVSERLGEASLIGDGRFSPHNGVPLGLSEAALSQDHGGMAVTEFPEPPEGFEEGAAGSAIPGVPPAIGIEARQWLTDEVGINGSAAEQIVEYLAASKIALGAMPSQKTIVFERFFDETGGTQFVIHSPFGSRLNRAWGLSLRKRFCRQFNFELQAAATEDAIVLSLSPVHSFPMEDVARYLRSTSVRDLLIQAMLVAPMFAIRWRWNASRALAVLRWNGGRKVPPQIQRIIAEDLVAAIFPDQVACAENLAGEREIPDHPLVKQTVRDCLQEAMDIDGLEALLRSLEAGEINIVVREMTEPSPLAQEILNARPYAFLDDAPLEERRTQAVMSRRWLDPQTASDLGTLDQGAIDRVREESWPDVNNADELHDALLQLGFLTDQEGGFGRNPWEVAGFAQNTVAASGELSGGVIHPDGWSAYLEALGAERRAARMQTREGGPVLWVAAERLPHLNALFPDSRTEPAITAPESAAVAAPSFEESLVEILRGRMEALGPITAEELAVSTGLSPAQIERALISLEAEGFILRGRFTPGRPEGEWCVRRLLSRIHSYTLNRLRKEIEPVSAADFIRFLLDWQSVDPEHQVEGAESLAGIIEQLEGFEAPAASWESEIFPARLVEYEPEWLDSLCLSGRVAWARLTPPKIALDKLRSAGPVKNTPITLVTRKSLPAWNSISPLPGPDGLSLSAVGQQVHDHLINNGASFFHDFVEGAGLLKTQVEDGLAELVAFGLVTADSFTGLRALLTPSSKRTAASKRRSGGGIFGMEHAGRWSRIRREQPPGAGTSAEAPLRGIRNSQSDRPAVNAEHVERIARTLLRRYGVVVRRLLDREGIALPWRELLKVYHRLEARGEIRGGRFVAGSSGEQFALPEAVGMLRNVRRKPKTGQMISISAADPLNLVGIMTPGGRTTSLSSNRILYRDGEPIATLEGGNVNYLVELAPAAQWEAKNALVRRRVPPELRSYLGQSA